MKQHAEATAGAEMCTGNYVCTFICLCRRVRVSWNMSVSMPMHTYQHTYIQVYISVETAAVGQATSRQKPCTAGQSRTSPATSTVAASSSRSCAVSTTSLRRLGGRKAALS